MALGRLAPGVTMEQARIEMSTLIREADAAMYAAKRNGRARWELSYDVSDRVPAV